MLNINCSIPKSLLHWAGPVTASKVLIADGNYPFATRASSEREARVPQPCARAGHCDRCPACAGRCHSNRDGAGHGSRIRRRAIHLWRIPRHLAR